MTTNLEGRFNEEMSHIYVATAEFSYLEGHVGKMVAQGYGLQAAKRVLNDKPWRHGFMRLFQKDQLGMSVEALALQETYRPLFTREELTEAKRRLDYVSYEFTPDDL